MSASKNLTQAVARLNKHLVTVATWMDVNRIRVNAAKTVAVAFNHKGKLPKTQLVLGGIPIPWSSKAKYLGVILDSKLTFAEHAAEARRKAGYTIHLLYPLLNRKSKLSPEMKLRIYKSIIRPALTYACPIWHLAKKTTITRIAAVQNKTLRMAINAPYYLANAVIARDTGVEPLEEYVRKTASKFAESIRSHTNPTINTLSEISAGSECHRRFPLNPANLQPSHAHPNIRPPADPPPELDRSRSPQKEQTSAADPALQGEANPTQGTPLNTPALTMRVPLQDAEALQVSASVYPPATAPNNELQRSPIRPAEYRPYTQ